MDQDQHEELQETLKRMQHASDAFYGMAVRIGHHQFIEFAGLMNEYIKMCQEMAGEGIDFTQNELQAKDYQVKYVAEKLDCIFGQSLTDRKNMQAFLTSLFEKVGWPADTSVLTLRPQAAQESAA